MGIKAFALCLGAILTAVPISAAAWIGTRSSETKETEETVQVVYSPAEETAAYDFEESFEENENVKPVIIYPAENDRLYSEDSIAVRYYAPEGAGGYIILYDESGVINMTEIESGTVFNTSGEDMHYAGKGGMCLIDEKYIEPEKIYSLQIVMDYNTSEAVHFSTFTGAEEVIKNLLKKNTAPEFKYTLEQIAPKGQFTSSAKAAQMMETITINVWKYDSEGKKYADSVKLTVNKNLKANYAGAFGELYEMGFPVKSVGCYNYRNTHGGRLSEHALGTAVDINPNENYCLYSDGTKVGTLYKPYENPYSVTNEVVAVFKKYGFGWGGDWGSTPDYMHFSYFES
ncbi:MAG: M15 family metallopeptidase [Clostridiales bacterium]|nr:M15 family metallopeptidase [Clostridiales bacterium]